jgi:hypothetical protein
LGVEDLIENNINTLKTEFGGDGSGVFIDSAYYNDFTRIISVVEDNAGNIQERVEFGINSDITAPQIFYTIGSGDNDPAIITNQGIVFNFFEVGAGLKYIILEGAGGGNLEVKPELFGVEDRTNLTPVLLPAATTGHVSGLVPNVEILLSDPKVTRSGFTLSGRPYNQLVIYGLKANPGTKIKLVDLLGNISSEITITKAVSN